MLHKHVPEKHGRPINRQYRPLFGVDGLMCFSDSRLFKEFLKVFWLNEEKKKETHEFGFQGSGHLQWNGSTERTANSVFSHRNSGIIKMYYSYSLWCLIGNAIKIQSDYFQLGSSSHIKVPAFKYCHWNIHEYGKWRSRLGTKKGKYFSIHLLLQVWYVWFMNETERDISGMGRG